MTPEGQVKADVKKLLDRYKPHIWYYMPVQTGFGQQGIPDFIICLRGRLIAVECKAERGKVTALQRLQLSLISGCGGTALIVDPDDIPLLEAHLNMISTQ